MSERDRSAGQVTTNSYSVSSKVWTSSTLWQQDDADSTLVSIVSIQNSPAFIGYTNQGVTDVQAGSTEHQHMQCVSRGISVCKMYRELGRYIIGREISGSTIPIVYCRRELMTVVLELSICGCWTGPEGACAPEEVWTDHPCIPYISLMTGWLGSLYHCPTSAWFGA